MVGCTGCSFGIGYLAATHRLPAVCLAALVVEQVAAAALGAVDVQQPVSTRPHLSIVGLLLKQHAADYPQPERWVASSSSKLVRLGLSLRLMYSARLMFGMRLNRQ